MRIALDGALDESLFLGDGNTRKGYAYVLMIRRLFAALFAATLTSGVATSGLSEEKKDGKPAAHVTEISLTQPAATPASRSLSRGQVLARTASSFRGSPYRFGGRSAKTGFDCSGLVQVVCQKWGVYLPRVASQQYRMGVAVKKTDLQAGDLVFFQNTYKRGLSHVGIYLGENRFVHAATRKKGVIISRLDSGYHLAHYYGARRLNLSKLPVPQAARPAEPLTKEKVYVEDETSSAPQYGE